MCIIMCSAIITLAIFGAIVEAGVMMQMQMPLVVDSEKLTIMMELDMDMVDVDLVEEVNVTLREKRGATRLEAKAKIFHQWMLETLVELYPKGEGEKVDEEKLHKANKIVNAVYQELAQDTKDSLKANYSFYNCVEGGRFMEVAKCLVEKIKWRMTKASKKEQN